ncbi:MAG: TatD family hydrolase [Candidatus Azobacteroides sp.]|nr:TatD family hydrolase [Candidatus Azobacteroides sp.]
MIDTHSHLYLEDYDEDLPLVIKRAKKAGIERILMPNIDISSIERMHRTEEKYPDYCLSMMGLHPTSVKEDYVQQLKKMEQLLKERRYYAVGEIGMDLYWDKTFLKEQTVAFEEQLMWAKDLGLPVVIHVRKAFEHVMDSLHRIGTDGLKGVFHAFSGSGPVEIMKLKTFKMGIGGVVTFKNSTLPETLKNIPVDFLVTETDSPFLTPVPYRGKRNESAYVPYIVKTLADVYEMPEKEIDRITTRNAIELFNLNS